MKKLSNLNGTGYSRQQLLGRSSSISTSAKRDILLLGERGLTLEFIERLDKKRKEYEAMQQYSTIRINKKDVTIVRNEYVDLLIDETEQLRSQMFPFEIMSNTYEPVLHLALSNKSVANLITLAEQTLQFMQAKKDALLEYLITDQTIANYSTLLENLRESHYLQINATDEADNSTTGRSELKAELFKMLLIISNYGKVYWKRKDPKKYKDYCLSEPPSSSNDTEYQVNEPDVEPNIQAGGNLELEQTSLIS